MKKYYNNFYKKDENKEENQEFRKEILDVVEEAKSEELKYGEPRIKTEDKKDNVLVDNCSYLNVRSEPRKEGEVKHIVKKGSTLILLDDSDNLGDWIKIKDPETKVEGYIMKSFSRR
jgi:hypothetical protein